MKIFLFCGQTEEIVLLVCYQLAVTLNKLNQELKDGIAKFVVDKNTDCMKMRSALKLITVTPINSISASSNEHMANKVGWDSIL